MFRGTGWASSGNTVSSQLGPAGVKSVCCSLCFSERVDSQGACRELQDLGKSSYLPFLCLGVLEWNSKGPAEMSGGSKEGCGDIWDVLQRVGRGVMMVLVSGFSRVGRVPSQQQKQFSSGTSLVVQWLRLLTSTSGDNTVSIPHWGTKIPRAAQQQQQQQKQQQQFNSLRYCLPGRLGPGVTGQREPHLCVGDPDGALWAQARWLGPLSHQGGSVSIWGSLPQADLVRDSGCSSGSLTCCKQRLLMLSPAAQHLPLKNSWGLSGIWEPLQAPAVGHSHFF